MLTLSQGLEGNPVIYGNRYGGVMQPNHGGRKCLCEPNQTYNSGLNLSCRSSWRDGIQPAVMGLIHRKECHGVLYSRQKRFEPFIRREVGESNHEVYRRRDCASSGVPGYTDGSKEFRLLLQAVLLPGIPYSV